ncbi:MAG: SH3 domain-containing protein [Okeania sp. SIO2D1]|nr:SH3 domain-containing protein [Okeania sp. SIO2D1]
MQIFFTYLIAAICLIQVSHFYVTDHRVNAQTEVNVPTYLNEGGIKVYPVDEASKNPDFLKFRQELEQAITNKDLGFLIKHTDENIQLFGTYQGIDTFMNFWELDKQPQQSKLWKTLEDTIKLGGKFQDNNFNFFIAPYTFFTPGVSDFYSKIIVTDTDVAMRNIPSSKGEILGLLSYDVVSLIPSTQSDIETRQTTPPVETIDGETYPWLKVQTAEGIQGYVYGKYLRQLLDYRVGFKKKNDTWKMVFFVAGD